MKLIKVAAAVLNQTPLDWDNNEANIRQVIRDARAQQISILCLPELSISGYGCEDAFHSPATSLMSWRVLEALLPETAGMIVSFGLPIMYQTGAYSAACMVVDGKIIGLCAKQFLAGDGLHYEPRWFKAWRGGVKRTLTMNGQTYPLGDLCFDIGGVRVGFEICEEAWVANRPGGKLAARGVDIILNPSASHFAFGKIAVRRRFVLEGSRAFGVAYVYANLLGNEAGRAIYDGGGMIASAGELLAEGPRFSFTDRGLTTAVIDVEATRMKQARTASFQPDWSNAEENHVVTAGYRYPALQPVLPCLTLDEWEKSPRLKEQEFARAVALALCDYMRKSRARGFVVSLSGGADSAAVSVLVGLMVELGARELGAEELWKKLGDMPKPAGFPGTAAMTRAILSCAYQGTINSSDTTREAARAVAEEVGAEFLEWSIENMVKQYVDTVSAAFGRPLTWEQDDIALQNIQARVRSPGIWMLTNLRNALLLSTSNRSEAAVGYATMDGDTSGGLSPVAGIDKAFLRQWLSWMETEGVVRPLPALRKVNVQAPTAELRPLERVQTDEADLMPYPLLDAIERAAIRDKLAPLDVYNLMRVQFPQYTEEQLTLWVDRFFRLWCRNQWKRERYAPSFHVDDENLDPKTWCRFPILSGGFNRELREMKETLSQPAQGSTLPSDFPQPTGTAPEKL